MEQITDHKIPDQHLAKGVYEQPSFADSADLVYFWFDELICCFGLSSKEMSDFLVLSQVNKSRHEQKQ
jgi:hypothetical protein